MISTSVSSATNSSSRGLKFVRSGPGTDMGARWSVVNPLLWTSTRQTVEGRVQELADQAVAKGGSEVIKLRSFSMLRMLYHSVTY